MLRLLRLWRRRIGARLMGAEVTSEMADAGLAVLWSHGLGSTKLPGPDGRVVMEIFLSMRLRAADD